MSRSCQPKRHEYRKEHYVINPEEHLQLHSQRGVRQGRPVWERGRNIIPGTDDVVTTLAIQKRSLLPADGHAIELRRDLLNRPNFETPNANHVSPAVGRITGAGRPRVVQVTLLYVLEAPCRSPISVFLTLRVESRETIQIDCVLLDEIAKPFIERVGSQPSVGTDAPSVPPATLCRYRLPRQQSDKAMWLGEFCPPLVDSACGPYV